MEPRQAFHAIQKHFGDYMDDMSEFHGYAVRKQTVTTTTNGGLHDTHTTFVSLPPFSAPLATGI